MSGRKFDAALDLLDRQIVDKDGMMAGVVDDLEFEWDEAGGRAAFVTTILSGPGALSRRLGGRLGRWLGVLHHHLHPDQDPGPATISFGVVKRVTNHVEVIVGRGDLEMSRSPDWTRDKIISKIPGAGHAPE
jgi:sporulation protein YlmC with PRC-barrel domain